MRSNIRISISNCSLFWYALDSKDEGLYMWHRRSKTGSLVSRDLGWYDNQCKCGTPLRCSFIYSLLQLLIIASLKRSCLDNLGKFWNVVCALFGLFMMECEFENYFLNEILNKWRFHLDCPNFFCEFLFVSEFKIH